MTARDTALTAAAAAAWGICFVLLQALTPMGSPLILAGVRALLGGATVGAAVVMRGGPRRLLHGGAGWRVTALLALLNGAIALGAMFLAAGRAGVAAETVVGNTQPILLGVAGAVIFGERVGRRGATGIALGAVGVLLVAAGGRTSGSSLGGLSLALLSSAAPAAGTILMRRLVGRVDLLVVTTWQFLAGGAVLLGAAMLVGEPLTVRLGGSGVLALALLGVVGTGLAYVVWFGLLERVPLAHLGSALYLVPVAGVVAAFVTGDAIGGSQLAGLAAMLVGVALATPGRRRRPGAFFGPPQSVLRHPSVARSRLCAWMSVGFGSRSSTSAAPATPAGSSVDWPGCRAWWKSR